AAIKVQQIISEENLLDRVQTKGAWLGAELQSRLGEHPQVGNIRGRGYFWGIELVEDKASKRPFDPEVQLTDRFGQALKDQNLLLYPVKSFVDDTHGDGAIVAPPYNATDDELLEIVNRTARAIEALFDSV
ncbi:MAG: aminotransferase class III-fold pyridoxal phosphate-dependent enzyme, partial [Chloroflexota bacterium]